METEDPLGLGPNDLIPNLETAAPSQILPTPEPIILVDEDPDKCFTCNKVIIAKEVALFIEIKQSCTTCRKIKICLACKKKLNIKETSFPPPVNFLGSRILPESKIIINDGIDHGFNRCFCCCSSLGHIWPNSFKNPVSLQEGVLDPSSRADKQELAYEFAVYLCKACFSWKETTGLMRFVTALKFPAFDLTRRTAYLPPIFIQRAPPGGKSITYPVSMLVNKAMSILDRFKTEGASLSSPPEYIVGDLMYIHHTKDKTGNIHWTKDGFNFEKGNTRVVKIQNSDHVIKETNWMCRSSMTSFSRRTITSSQLPDFTLVHYLGEAKVGRVSVSAVGKEVASNEKFENVQPMRESAVTSNEMINKSELQVFELLKVKSEIIDGRSGLQSEQPVTDGSGPCFRRSSPQGDHGYSKTEDEPGLPTQGDHGYSKTEEEPGSGLPTISAVVGSLPGDWTWTDRLDSTGTSSALPISSSTSSVISSNYPVTTSRSSVTSSKNLINSSISSVTKSKSNKSSTKLVTSSSPELDTSSAQKAGNTLSMSVTGSQRQPQLVKINYGSNLGRPSHSKPLPLRPGDILKVQSKSPFALGSQKPVPSRKMVKGRISDSQIVARATATKLMSAQEHRRQKLMVINRSVRRSSQEQEKPDVAPPEESRADAQEHEDPGVDPLEDSLIPVSRHLSRPTSAEAGACAEIAEECIFNKQFCDTTIYGDPKETAPLHTHSLLLAAVSPHLAGLLAVAEKNGEGQFELIVPGVSLGEIEAFLEEVIGTLVAPPKDDKSVTFTMSEGLWRLLSGGKVGGVMGSEAMVWLEPTSRERKEGGLKLTSWSRGTGKNILADRGDFNEERDDVECEKNVIDIKESLTTHKNFFNIETASFVPKENRLELRKCFKGNRLELRKCFVDIENLHIRNPSEIVHLNLLRNANRTKGGTSSNDVPDVDGEEDDITYHPLDDDCQIVEFKQSIDGRKKSKGITLANDDFYNGDLTYQDDPHDDDYRPGSSNDDDQPKSKKRKNSGNGKVKKKKTEKWSFSL